MQERKKRFDASKAIEGVTEHPNLVVRVDDFVRGEM
jgi:hypothetical protein